MNLDGLDPAILVPALAAGVLVIATHVPLGQQVLKRGIIFIDLAIAQIAGLGVLLANTLGERGANVHYLNVYNRVPHEPTLADLEDLEFALNQGRIGFVIVMSVETLVCLAQIIPAQDLSLLRHTTLVAPSDRVLQTASELIPGIATELAPGPQAPAMVNTLIRLTQTG